MKTNISYGKLTNEIRGFSASSLLSIINSGNGPFKLFPNEKAVGVEIEDLDGDFYISVHTELGVDK